MTFLFIYIDNIITDAGIRTLCKSLIYMTKLEELYLACIISLFYIDIDNNIQNQGLNDIDNVMSYLKNLKKLTLEENKINNSVKDDFLRKYNLPVN